MQPKKSIDFFRRKVKKRQKEAVQLRQLLFLFHDIPIKYKKMKKEKPKDGNLDAWHIVDEFCRIIITAEVKANNTLSLRLFVPLSTRLFPHYIHPEYALTP